LVHNFFPPDLIASNEHEEGMCRNDSNEQHEPVRQEDAYAQAKNKNKKRKTNDELPVGKALIVDARPAVKTVFKVDLTDAPSHMKDRMRDTGKTVYHLILADPGEDDDPGEYDLDGLVDGNVEADVRSAEITAYFMSKCIPRFEFTGCEPIQSVFTLESNKRKPELDYTRESPSAAETQKCV